LAVKDDPRVLAWDGPTRAFKWALVALVLGGWLSNKFGASVPAWHKWNGYAVLILIVFRILWGFVGGTTARFASFVAGPRRALDYLRGGVAYLGHNPVGGWMVLALLALVAGQCLTGLYSADEDRVVIDGPLARTVTDATIDFAARWHHRLFDALKILVVLHIAANVFYTWVKRDPLIPAMISGRKAIHAYADAKFAEPGPWGRAAFCLMVAAGLVLGGIIAAGGKIF